MKKETVIVTGASSGIGLEIARYFLEKGDNVVINSTTPEKLESAFIKLGAGENLAMVVGDVSKIETGQQLVKTAVARFGSVDILVNNAGIFETKPFLDVDEEYLDRFLDTNLKGTYFTTQAAISQMLKQEGGVVINIGSPLVTHGIGSLPCSAALTSKAGIHSLTIQLASEFGKNNIRINTVAPGVIRTPMYGDNADANVGLHLLTHIGEVQDIAEMVYTVGKSTFITGAIINVDGGMGSGHILQ